VFANAPSQSMADRFPEINHFAFHIATLMVNEIKKRATNLSTGLYFFKV